MTLNKRYRDWLLARARRHDAKAAKLRARAKKLTPARKRNGLIDQALPEVK